MKSKDGFTLVEMVIASFILAMVFGGAMKCFVAAARSQYLANEYYAASVLARNRVEYAKIYPFQSLAMLIETDVQLDRYGEPDGDGVYWRTTTVTPSVVNPVCIDVIVEVDYETRPGVMCGVPVMVATMVGEGG
ncbi:MAG: prepilin-type N-terminal cleavage/methylation domain-containing protein [Kiritimatiellae bacterium]|nr:prepilin-type N-terminal cleavage/methylation domain-containing protein [Kiritimatiellia bacterium]